MAMALVQGMAEDWEPEQYHDTYREDVLALIEKKVKAHQTKTITMPEPGEPKRETGKVIDLVALLQASLGKKPGKAAAADDDDDDEPPPPKKRRPAAEDDDEEEAPPPRARKTASHSSDRVAASGAAPKRKTAAKAAAKPAAKPAAKKAAAKSTASTAPARRRKAA
jgi:DNA end-binding protein Ku